MAAVVILVVFARELDHGRSYIETVAAVKTLAFGLRHTTNPATEIEAAS